MPRPCWRSASAQAEAVAVCLLHSYMNPSHERQVRDLLRSSCPAYPVCLSSDVLPEIREYERASTDGANAFVQPVIARVSAATSSTG